MIRTRLAQAAAVATLAVSTVLLLPGAASAAPGHRSVAATVPVAVDGADVTPGNGTWG